MITDSNGEISFRFYGGSRGGHQRTLIRCLYLVSDHRHLLVRSQHRGARLLLSYDLSLRIETIDGTRGNMNNSYYLHDNCMYISHPDGTVSVMVLEGVHVYTLSPAGVSKDLAEDEVDG